jgi:phage-related minor tail protein
VPVASPGRPAPSRASRKAVAAVGKPKKRFYKDLGFWLIVLVVVLVGFGALSMCSANQISSASDIIGSQTGATGTDLQNLTSYAEKMSTTTDASWDDSARVISVLYSRLGLTGSTLESLALKTQELAIMGKTDQGQLASAIATMGIDWKLSPAQLNSAENEILAASQVEKTSVASVMSQLADLGPSLRSLKLSFTDGLEKVVEFNAMGLSESEIKSALTHLAGVVAKTKKK